ncbi:hypothetical protein GOP80_02655 [Planococcaceae bacterium Storch 2/2-2]|nr:hypothetical protein [Planococcaceae bacterium Storch 2/2-2]
MRWINSIILNALFFMIISWLFPTFVVEDFGAALVASFVLSIANILIRPFLFILTLPINILTLGMFSFILNAVMLLLVNKVTGAGFHINGFGSALLVALMMSFLNVVVNKTILKNA